MRLSLGLKLATLFVVNVLSYGALLRGLKFPPFVVKWTSWIVTNPFKDWIQTKKIAPHATC